MSYHSEHDIRAHQGIQGEELDESIERALDNMKPKYVNRPTIRHMIEAGCDRISVLLNPCHVAGSQETDEALFVVFFKFGSNPLSSPWGYAPDKESIHSLRDEALMMGDPIPWSYPKSWRSIDS